MPSIGVNLRVTGHCSQGGRKYMEDFFSVAYQQSLSDERDLEYAFIGIYDGLCFLFYFVLLFSSSFAILLFMLLQMFSATKNKN